MALRVFSAAPDAVKERLRRLDHGELRSSGCWLTHFLLIISTVPGVYLAARAGLRQALVFAETNVPKYRYNPQTTLASEALDAQVAEEFYHAP